MAQTQLPSCVQIEKELTYSEREKLKLRSPTRALFISRNRPAGFFSNYFHALSGIMFAHQNGLTPILDFPIAVSLPGRPLGESGTWSKYFNVTEASTLDEDVVFEKLCITEAPLDLEMVPVEDLFTLAGKYLPLTLELRNELDAAFGAIQSRNLGRILGIHYRGTDMNWYPSHPTPLRPNQLVSTILESSILSDFECVYVATDTPAVVRLLKKELQRPVITSQDIDRIGVNPKTVDPIKSVILDAWLLSKCEGLVHSKSNVSWAARVFRGNEYDSRLEVSLGQNPSKLPFSVTKYILRTLTPDFLRREIVKELLIRNKEA